MRYTLKICIDDYNYVLYILELKFFDTTMVVIEIADILPTWEYISL